MSLKDFLQGRRNDAELGQGIWRRAHDRFNRGIDRFHQILEKLPDDGTLELVVPEANALADLLPRVRTIAARAQQLAPSNSTDIPASPSGIYSELHRCLSRAGNSVALCAEALAMVRCAGSCEFQCNRQEIVMRRVETVREHIERAEELLQQAHYETTQRHNEYAQQKISASA
ncbi:dehydrogenase [Rothia sp. CCM 9418]|uniref:dehydrogenase n=1 Tax=unclassified Rothia (in: high G+C Gram-positive bacteria) TaxID=2689056 RepID=UPI003ACECD81